MGEAKYEYWRRNCHIQLVSHIVYRKPWNGFRNGNRKQTLPKSVPNSCRRNFNMVYI